ncbi:glucosaminidase domain-containing protein [Paenibacillus xylanexedens]|uniref:glucosaminidase domain-containing protein n=1 Tax=Paenibacillus xylanexedens TaxID=528191 RepID=UPI000F51F77E|nr:glucosaminidase domain-containing protein [Paenibacillus xylanexedens]RPK20040.1 hypothetical protein EDO6_06557 [Paenibacillus xylanexedens]
MKKVVQLSLSLMLILPVATGCMSQTVEPKESKTVEPSTLNTIQTIRLQPHHTLLERFSELERLEKEKAEQARVAKVVKAKKAAALKAAQAKKAKEAQEAKEKAEAKEKKVNLVNQKVNVVKVSAEAKETSKSTVAKKLDTHLDGELKGKGSVFANSAKSNNVDPYLIAAIAMHETGNGTSSAIRNKNNVGGLMGRNGLKRFDSVDASIEYMSNLIEEKYVANGRETIKEISVMYAPVGADNDPNGLNGHWVSGVRSIYNQLKGTSL